MIPYEKLVKRTRRGINDFEKTYFNNIVCDKKDEDCKDLFFIEHFNANNPVVLNEIKRMDYVYTLSKLLLKSPEISQDIRLPTDECLKTVIANDRLYTVYFLFGTEPYIPKNLKDIYDFSKNITMIIEKVHENRKYISNIVDGLFLTHDNTKVSISPAIVHCLKTADYTEKKSIILGSEFVSPYQIIWDILNSKYQPAEVEYNEFKQNMLNFWQRILKTDNRKIPEVCQTYYSRLKGGQDYIDYCINRWCVVKTINKKQHVLKDASKVNNVSFLYTIDWFSLGILLNKYIEVICESSNSNTKLSLSEITNYIQRITKIIFCCLTMEKPTFT